MTSLIALVIALVRRRAGMLPLLAALVAGAAIPMGASQMARGTSKQPKAQRIDSTADSREIAVESASAQLVFKWDANHALVVTTEDAKGSFVSHTGTLPGRDPSLPKYKGPRTMKYLYGGGKLGMAMRMGSAAAGVAANRGKGGGRSGLLGVPVAKVDRLE